jgi:hypothetical protein
LSDAIRLGWLRFLALVIDPTKNFDPTGAAAILQKRGGLFFGHFDDVIVGDRGTPIRMPAIAKQSHAESSGHEPQPFTRAENVNLGWVSVLGMSLIAGLFA